jgi:hypothetical protein
MGLTSQGQQSWSGAGDTAGMLFTRPKGHLHQNILEVHEPEGLGFRVECLVLTSCEVGVAIGLDDRVEYAFGTRVKVFVPFFTGRCRRT